MYYYVCLFVSAFCLSVFCCCFVWFYNIFLKYVFMSIVCCICLLFLFTSLILWLVCVYLFYVLCYVYVIMLIAIIYCNLIYFMFYVYDLIFFFVFHFDICLIIRLCCFTIYIYNIYMYVVCFRRSAPPSRQLYLPCCGLRGRATLKRAERPTRCRFFSLVLFCFVAGLFLYYV